MGSNIRVMVIGAGNMGASHARAYHQIDGYDVAGIVDLNSDRCRALADELAVSACFTDMDEGLKTLQPQAVAVCSFPDTHQEFSIKSLKAGAHVFTEKPLAVTVAGAREVVETAKTVKKKVVVGYILRHHPAWIKFIEQTQLLGKPLIMRMNLNQQSSGKEWGTHKFLMKSMSPIVDCGVHYVDVMCQMTRSKPVQVQAIGARVSDEIDPAMYNYGNLQVIFEDGSVGWYEAGWGPMMSETAFFVKDVIGPKGSVSIADPAGKADADSSDIDSHTKTNSLLVHHASCDANGQFTKKDTIIDTSDEPDHQELCNREQQYFLKAILDDLDLTEHWEDAVNSLQIVLAADTSVKTGKIVKL